LYDLTGARTHGGRHPRNRPRPRGSLLERFNRYVIRPDDPTACWGWSAALFESGYPAIAAEPPSRAMLLGHRVSYELHVGAIPPGLCVLHHCDVRSCCNPEHLFVGTKADNNLDKLLKGRQPHGEAHHLAKLTQAQADLIRAIHAGRASMQQIAALFGVSRALVCLVLKNRIWATA
jgi:HNH endonuclease